MQNIYDFVGGPLHGQKKRLDDADLPLGADGGTYRTTGGGHSVHGSPMAYTALFWPARDTAAEDSSGAPAQVGKPFPLDPADVGDCPGEKLDGSGIFTAYCVLDEDHQGRHVATNGQVVVEIWD